MKANCVICGKEFDKKNSSKTCGKECSMHRVRACDRERARAYYSTNKAKILRARSDYYEANPENRRRRYAANPGKYQQQGRDRRAENPERVRETERKYRAANQEKIRKASRAYYEANLEKRREYGRNHYRVVALTKQFGFPQFMLDAMCTEEVLQKSTEQERTGS